MSPEAVCGALKDACDQVEAGWKVRLALLRVLEAHVADELQGVYRELNAHLVERQILPEVRPVFRRNPPSAPRVSSRGAPASVTPADIHAVLAGLLGAQSSPRGRRPRPPAAVAFVTPATRGFVQSLTGLQQPGPAAAGDAQALANVIRDLRASPQTAALPAIDAMTIDIVAMLFDFVFEDRQIPAAVKALLGRLQIPTLKVALSTARSSRRAPHPARQLLDRLARAAIGLDESSSRGEATLAKLEHVVGARAGRVRGRHRALRHARRGDGGVPRAAGRSGGGRSRRARSALSRSASAARSPASSPRRRWTAASPRTTGCRSRCG